MARTELSDLNPAATARQSPSEEPLRTGSDARGSYSVEAHLVKLDGGKVHLKRAVGTTIQVLFDRWSDAGQRYLANRQ